MFRYQQCNLGFSIVTLNGYNNGIQRRFFLELISRLIF
jgi:hypothetical protein